MPQNRVSYKMNYFCDRIERVRKAMQSDALLVLPAAAASVRNRDTHFPYRAHSDLLYLTGVNEEELALIITKDECHIFAQTRNPERERWVGRVRGHEYFLNLFHPLSGKIFVHDPGKILANFSEIAKGKKLLYYDFGASAVLDQKLLQSLHDMATYTRKGIFAPRTVTLASELLHECRLFKDAYDLDCMRRAAAISSAAHNKARELIADASDVISEYAIKALIEHEFMRAGADRLAYPSIVAAHDNATVLHYEGTQGSASPGEFVLIDAGAEVDGYASDITRTTCVGGQAKTSQVKKDLYDLVKEAQKDSIARSRSGETIESVHQAAVETLTQGLWDMGLFKKVPKRRKDDKTGKIEEVEGEILTAVASAAEAKELEYYSLFYMHRTSHFLGLDVHDVGDYFEGGASRRLETGMVITIEPGLYFPPEYEFLSPEIRGTGIRIEDDVLITASGNEILTAACLS